MSTRINWCLTALFILTYLPSFDPSPNMKFLTLFFSLFSIICIVHGGKKTACPNYFCGSFSVDYPFKLSSSDPQSNCTYMDLTCNSTLGTPIVNLPYAGDFFVRDIAYDDTNGPFIQLYDPGNCLMGRLMQNLNLSSSPYKAIMYENYTYFMCPTSSDTHHYVALQINCLSNSTNSTVAIVSSSVVNLVMMIAFGCQVIGHWRLPVLESLQFESNGINSDLYLTWNSTTCEVRQQYNDKSGKNLLDKLTAKPYISPIGLALSLVLMLCVVQLLKCFLKNPESQLAGDALPENSSPGVTSAPARPNATGPDGSKINFCTELVVFSESRIIMGPGCNTTCSICLESYRDREIVRSMVKCEHCFHAYCIELWLRKNSTCPVCRTILAVAEL